MNIYEKILELDSQKEYADICNLLDDLKEVDVKGIAKALPMLLYHSNFLVRIAAMEIVGEYKLKKYLPYLKANLKHRLVTVRMFAIHSYYEMQRKKALPLLLEYSKSSNMNLKCCALARLYIETQDEQYFEVISKILRRKNCRSLNQFIVFHSFEYYLEIEEFPEVVGLFKFIYDNSPHKGLTGTIESKLFMT